MFWLKTDTQNSKAKRFENMVVERLSRHYFLYVTERRFCDVSRQKRIQEIQPAQLIDEQTHSANNCTHSVNVSMCQ